MRLIFVAKNSSSSLYRHMLLEILRKLADYGSHLFTREWEVEMTHMIDFMYKHTVLNIIIILPV